jgi:hypothetical protein
VAGNVIGYRDLDNGISMMGQAFPVVISDICVLLKVKKDIFENQIWAKTKNYKTEVKIRCF